MIATSVGVQSWLGTGVVLAYPATPNGPRTGSLGALAGTLEKGQVRALSQETLESCKKLPVPSPTW